MADSRRTSKVTIVGAGSVGATIAYACLIRGVANSVTLYDVNADKTRAEVLDLNQGIQFVPMASVTGSDDIAVTTDSDIVVVTAGAKQRPGQTRLELAGINVELCRKLVPQLVELSPNALLLLVTNPVDVLTYAATKFSGLPTTGSSGPAPSSTARGCACCSPSTPVSPCRASTPTSSASTATRNSRCGAARRSDPSRCPTGPHPGRSRSTKAPAPRSPTRWSARPR